jgi:hypothetical protein
LSKLITLYGSLSVEAVMRACVRQCISHAALREARELYQATLADWGMGSTRGVSVGESFGRTGIRSLLNLTPVIAGWGKKTGLTCGILRIFGGMV